MVIFFKLIKSNLLSGSAVPTTSKVKPGTNTAQHEQQLLASVNSFANYIRDHFGPFDEPKPKSSPRVSHLPAAIV